MAKLLCGLDQPHSSPCNLDIIAQPATREDEEDLHIAASAHHIRHHRIRYTAKNCRGRNLQRKRRRFVDTIRDNAGLLRPSCSAAQFHVKMMPRWEKPKTSAEIANFSPKSREIGHSQQMRRFLVHFPAASLKILVFRREDGLIFANGVRLPGQSFHAPFHIN